MRFVALGDSYTIGTSVGAERALAEPARGAPGRTSSSSATWASTATPRRDLLNQELPHLDRLAPGARERADRRERRRPGRERLPVRRQRDVMLEGAARRGCRGERIVCVATPDYTVHAKGSAFGDPSAQGRRHRALQRHPARGGGEQRGHRLRATTSSRSARRRGHDPGAGGGATGLHPSGGSSTGRWVDAIEPAVEWLLHD